MGKIILRLDRIMADRKMSLNELSEKVGVSNVNLSKIKTGKISAIRFSTLEAICEVLDCQPGDILEYNKNGDASLVKTLDGDGKIISTTQQTYDEKGRQKSNVVRDGNGKITTKIVHTYTDTKNGTLECIITTDENGVYYNVAKVRGRKQSLSKLTEILKGYLEKGICEVAVLHAGCEDEAIKFRDSFKNLPNITSIKIAEISPALGVHGGPGLIGFSVKLVK